MVSPEMMSLSMKKRVSSNLILRKQTANRINKKKSNKERLSIKMKLNKISKMNNSKNKPVNKDSRKNSQNRHQK